MYSPLQRAVIAARACAYAAPSVKTAPAPVQKPEQFNPPVQVIPFVPFPPQTEGGRLKLHMIMRAVCTFFDISMLEMKSERRAAPVVRARQVYCYLARKHTLRSYPDIGRSFATSGTRGKDHTTIIHADKKIKLLIETDARLSGQVRAIEETIGVVSRESP